MAVRLYLMPHCQVVGVMPFMSGWLMDSGPAEWISRMNRSRSGLSYKDKIALLGKGLDGSVDDYRSVVAHLKVGDNVH
jgi:hypothetical protein